MPQLLSLSRAARLANVSRAELQGRIRRGDIETFEGQVAASDLLRLYPTVSLDQHETIDRVERIKAAAVPRQRDIDAVLPSPEVLVSRLRALADTLVEKASALEAAERILQQLADRLNALVDSSHSDIGSGLRETIDWLEGARQELAERPPSDSEARLLVKDALLRIMAANVKLIPSGHEFFVEGTETILDASVRSGLHLSYGCSSGNCGSCKARLLSGEVRRTRAHDYVLSEREKQMGYILTCSNTAVTDVVLEAAEAISVDDLPPQDIRATVRKVKRLGEDVIELQVQTPRTQTLRFMAGQRAVLTLEEGASAELSIASCPCDGRNLHFFVRRRSGHAVSEALFSGRVHHGQPITVRGPTGQFVLAEDSPEPAVFVAFGDGFAPIKSLIEHAVSIDLIESFHLYWSVPEPEGQYQAGWCRAMKESLDNFSYTPIIDATVEDLLALLRTDFPEPGGARLYVAGPRAQVQAFSAGLAGMGVPGGRLTAETID
jgi:CDP-4-dehydro-6-deoxyglucose reductase